jgi:4-amino-4-deoxy-L-arabinose transferase-like glycosyltransferase
VLIRVIWLHFYPAIAEWDGAIYHRTAQRIALGMGFVDTWNNLPPYKPTAFYPVGYPATLALLYKLFGSSWLVAAGLNVAASAIITACIVRLAHRSWGAAGAHLAAALFALAPGPVLYCSAFMTELLSAAILLTTIEFALRYYDSGGRLRYAVVCGLLLGYGGLVRPPALLIAPIIAWVMTPSPSQKTGHLPRLLARAKSMLVVGLACCAVVLPWTARNCRQLDGCALVSLNGGSNLWIGADPDAHGTYRDLRIGEACLRVRGEVSKDRCFGRLAIERIKSAPFRWISLAPLKLAHLLGYESSPVSYLRAATHGVAFRHTATLMFALMTAAHWIVLALAIVSVVGQRAAQRAIEQRLCVAIVLGFLAVHIVFFGVDRYHLVFIPILCSLAGGALQPSNPTKSGASAAP